MSQNTSILKNSLLGLVVLVVIGYGVFNSRFIIQGPEIVLEQVDEKKGSIISYDRTLFLKGNVQHSSFISINGRPIFIDETGHFNERLLLSSSVSIIDIYAKDKFGKEVRKKIDVLYQGETPLASYTKVAYAGTVASSTNEVHEETLKSPTPLIETEQEVVVIATSTEPLETGVIMSTISATTSSEF